MPQTEPEPWLRGTLTEVDAVPRQVLHAFQLTAEDIDRWCASLTDAELHARPYGLAPVAFHLCHIARSLDRLLTYAEGHQLSPQQLARLNAELTESSTAQSILAEFRAGLSQAAARVAAISPDTFNQPRYVGRKQLPTTVGGLLVHCAEHTQRHAGQAIVTAKVVLVLAARGVS